MTKLYHRVPDNMVGDTLYPLNELKEVHPKIYKNIEGKYEGKKRQRVKKRTIPYLDCQWNDVLHFTAVHPRKIKEALNTSRTLECYVIDSEQLTPNNTVVYLNNQSEEPTKENYTTYDPDKIDQYAELPKATKRYYKEMQSKVKRPLLFVNVPHILYKGSVDISDAKIVRA